MMGADLDARAMFAQEGTSWSLWANTNELQPVSLWVLVDATLNAAPSEFQILYSNKAASTPPGTVAQFDSGNHALQVTLAGMEVQILGAVR